MKTVLQELPTCRLFESPDNLLDSIIVSPNDEMHMFRENRARIDSISARLRNLLESEANATSLKPREHHGRVLQLALGCDPQSRIVFVPGVRVAVVYLGGFASESEDIPGRD